jgi:hypothetical protein
MKRRDMLKATKKIASAVLGGSEATIKWIAHVDSVVAKPPLSGLCCMVVVGNVVGLLRLSLLHAGLLRLDLLHPVLAVPIWQQNENENEG